jgi:hypothetical protein
MNTLSHSIKFWSKGTMQAKFLRHEGYLGAMGSFLYERIVPESPIRKPLYIVEDFSKTETLGAAHFGRLQTLDVALVPLGCLAGDYEADTIGIAGDSEGREYWLSLLEKNVGLYTKLAGGFPEEGVASDFETLFKRQLGKLREEPSSCGRISISGLLSLREQCLREAGFRDVFKYVKDRENMEAVAGLKELIKKVDGCEDERKRVGLLIDNVLGGNMYDWGSSSVATLLESGKLSFDEFKDKVGRPEMFNNTALLIDRLVGPGYKKVVIFVDNSGCDLVFGIIPFARYRRVY